MQKEVKNNQSFGEDKTELEVTLAEFDHEVKVKKALDRLMENEDFKLVVLEEYVTKERKSLTNFLCCGSETAESDSDIIVAKIKATGYFKGWLDIRIRHYEGLDNPVNRELLIKQLEENEELSEKE